MRQGIIRAKNSSQGKQFRNKVLAVVARIPRGQTLSYGAVARLAGNSQAARAVGSILRTNFDPKIPCHRVVRADGALGGYNRGIQRKQSLLAGEGNLQRGIISK